MFYNKGRIVKYESKDRNGHFRYSRKNISLFDRSRTDQTIDDQFSGTYKLDRFESFDFVPGNWNTDKSQRIDKYGFLQYDGGVKAARFIDFSCFCL